MSIGQCFVFLFHQGTERPHQGDVNTREAIPNTTEEVRYRIRLDLEILNHVSLTHGDSGGGQIYYHMAAEHLHGRRLNRDEEFYAVGFCDHTGKWGIR